jgi:hypothetical protein
MNRASSLSRRLVLLAVAVLTVILATSLAPAGGNKNPRILPPHANAGGLSYGEWSEEWWKWIIAIPAAESPVLDETGEFAGVGQEGNVWFLAGRLFSGESTRTITVPSGKKLFFPLYNWVFWAPDDLGTAEFVADHLGFTPEQIASMTDEELLRLLVNYTAGEPELTLTIDGKPASNLLDYYAESPAFSLFDTDLVDDLGVPISQPNLAVSSGFWIMLNPLPPGEHTIRWTVHSEHSIPDFDTDLDITYHINVVPGRR